MQLDLNSGKRPKTVSLAKVSVTIFLYFNLKQTAVLRNSVGHICFLFKKYFLENICVKIP
jgi:hypothetical protein